MNNEIIAKEIILKLEKSQTKSQFPNEFEEAIKDAFDFLGFKAEWIGGSGDTDVILTANIGKASYKITVDGKTSSSGKIPDSQIDWYSLKDHKEKNQANFVLIVGPNFSGGNLEKRAEADGVFLLKTEHLILLVKAHSEFPFTLTELRNLFAGKGDRSSQLDDILTQNRTRKDFLNQFKIVIKEMQSLQDGKLGYFTFTSLVGREKLDNVDIEPEEIQAIIKLLELPFIRAVESISPNDYILSLGMKDLSNLFLQISKVLETEQKPIIDHSTNQESITQQTDEKPELGSKYFKWTVSGDSIIANARKEDPYTHHCPISHFITIINTIVDIFRNQNLINQDMIFSKLIGKELSPDRPFKGKAEHYKIYMALGILEVEGLIKWTGSKRPLEFTLNPPNDSIIKWMDTKILQKKSN
jgi:hypothetical protein